MLIGGEVIRRMWEDDGCLNRHDKLLQVIGCTAMLHEIYLRRKRRVLGEEASVASVILSKEEIYIGLRDDIVKSGVAG